MKSTHLKQAFLWAIIGAVVCLAAWELYWRTQTDRYNAHLDDDRYMWAEHRRLVETATEDDVVIIGSSRTAFNFNTNIWAEEQGRRPINLSTDGKPVGPFLQDLVENSDFAGTIIMGVTPVLSFTLSDDPFWQPAYQWIRHYQKETYAQWAGHQISKPLQRNLVMLTATELDFANDLDLKSLLKRIPLQQRIPNDFVLPKFGHSDEHRNIFMYPSMKTDTTFASQVHKTWMSFLPHLPEHEVIAEIIPSVIEFYSGYIAEFQERGGKIILIRHKAEPQWNDHSQRMLPRAKVWDRLVAAIDAPAYHFEDHPFMQKHRLPDWSHMAADDGIEYTRDMVQRLIADGHLQPFSR
ncbi:MAG: hypothetical protein AAFN81_10155 [Bacteroidota bacterium]